MAHAPSDIVISDLVKTFPNGMTAIDHLDLRLPGGMITAITGPSGSGKSTLLHLIGGIEQTTAGSITIDGNDITAYNRKQLTTYRRGLGFVFQRYHLLPTLTALDNVTTPVLPYRTAFNKQDRARELLTAVGLSGREDSLPTRMSGGQQQRVAIARALINHPHTLIADEPTGNLDTANGRDVVNLIRELHATTGMTVLIATHELALASQCDHAIHIVDGRVVP